MVEARNKVPISNAAGFNSDISMDQTPLFDIVTSSSAVGN